MNKNLAFFIVILAVGGAIFGGKIIIDTAPETKKTKARERVKKVRTVTINPSDYELVVPATGKVIPAVKSEIIPEVSGKVEFISSDAVPGNMISKGDVMLKIDDRQYRLGLQLKKSDLTKAKAELRREQGSQKVALKEYKLLGRKLSSANRELVLRKPQLDIARARVEAAKAAVEQAEINLAHTVITAPISGIIAAKNTGLGSRVNISSPVFSIIAADKFWIEAEIFTKYIDLIDFSTHKSQGSMVKVYPQSFSDTYITGRVLKLLPELDSSGLMGKILIEVKDPLGVQNPNLPKLLLNNHVKMEISAKTLKNVTAIPEKLIRNSDSVWVYSRDNTLNIVRLDILHRLKNEVIVSQAIAGKELVETNISVPVEGMKLKRIENGG